MTRAEIFRTQSGFTLLEVLVALVIISLVFIAAVRSTDASVTSQGASRDMIVASWVAKDRIAEYRAGITLPSVGEREQKVSNANMQLVIHESLSKGDGAQLWNISLLVTNDEPQAAKLFSITSNFVQSEGQTE